MNAEELWQPMIDKFEYPLDLVVFTDTHYYSNKLGIDTPSYKKYDATNQKAVKNSPQIISAAFAQIAKSECKNIIFCGDATCDGDYDSHLEFIKLLYALKKCGKRVFAITSTHDYQDNGKTACYTGDKKTFISAPERTELFKMYKNFGPDDAFSVFEMSYAAELDENYILLALNSDKNGKGKSGYSAEHKEWIAKIALAAKKCGKRVIAFTHHPLISPCPVYSLIGKNDMMGEHTQIRDFLADLGISLVFTGHSHIHNISYTFSEKENIIYDISTSALAGYPGYYRNIRICGNNIHISSQTIDIPVKNIDLPLSEYLESKFLFMIDNTLEAAATDIDDFAACVDAMSIHPNVSYRIGWLVKPITRLIQKLKLGFFTRLVKKETENADLSEVNDKKVLDLIREIVLHLYSGNPPYTPDTAVYKTVMGFFEIIDSMLKLLHIKLRLCDYLRPMLYNSGIDDRETDVPYIADKKQIQAVCNNKYAQTVHESKKGPALLALTVLLILILLPLIPAIAIILALGFGINEIRFYKEIRGIKNE